MTGAHGARVDELPNVLWALRTTPKASSRESSFSLAFETEVVLPPEMLFPTLRTDTFEENNSEQSLRASLDLLKERRAKAHLRTLVYKKAMTRLYNHKVPLRLIKAKDLVLRKIKVSDPTQVRGKLAPNWEGPYRISDMVREGPYRLKTMGGSPIPRTWNASNMKKFYP